MYAPKTFLAAQFAKFREIGVLLDVVHHDHALLEEGDTAGSLPDRQGAEGQLAFRAEPLCCGGPEGAGIDVAQRYQSLLGTLQFAQRLQDGGELAFQVGQQGDAAAELLQSLQIPYLRAEVLLAQLQAVQLAANGQEHRSRRHVERDRNPVVGVFHAEAAGLEPEHAIDETHHQDDERRPPPKPRRGDPDRGKEEGEEGKSAGNQERPHRPLQRHGKQQQAHGNRSGAAPGRPDWAVSLA